MSKFFQFLFITVCIAWSGASDAQIAVLRSGPTTTGPWSTATPVQVVAPAVRSWWLQFDNQGDPPSGPWPNPYRVTGKIFRNGSEIYSATYTLSSAWANFYLYDHPADPGVYSIHVLFEVRNFFGAWVSQSETWTYNTIVLNTCYPDVTITGTFTTPLQESSTWIATSGTTVIPTGANVKLDADPDYYVELNPGFETQAGSVFVAQAYDGCFGGAPSLKVPDNTYVEEEPVALKDVPFDDPSELLLYPNPTNGDVTVRHPESVKELQVFSVVGQWLLTVPVATGSVETRIDLQEQPKGTYFVKAAGLPVKQLVKQ